MNAHKGVSHARAAPATGVALVLLLGNVAAALHAPAPPALRHNADGPPLGHTGGFGEPTCQACHADAQLNVPGGVLGVDGMPGAYEPGGRYRITIVFVSEGMTRAGFQAAFRFANGETQGKQAGRIEPIDTRVTVSASAAPAVEYVHHSASGTELAEPELASWSFVWTAPNAGDPVMIHVAANSANGDNSPLGDLVYTAEARSRAAGGR